MNHVRGYLDSAKGWFPLGLAAVYVLGFVVVGLHLAGYGASSLDLIKAQYLAAGFWFCCSSFVYRPRILCVGWRKTPRPPTE